MRTRIAPLAVVIAASLVLGACASRPVNPPITQVDTSTGYRAITRFERQKDKRNLVVLAFSGGGTRAAAFAYGVLETLRPMELVAADGRRVRMVDEIDVISGVSGGSFTALAYGLYGDKLFDVFETAFLKRNVQGELVRRVLSPASWGDWGRSETASDLYDEILFKNATFADLERGPGPFIVANATDITTGTRIPFHQGFFDFMCSDVGAVRLSRAATASSAVPFAFSPVTLDNHGGTCNYKLPPGLVAFSDPATAPRPAARVLSRLQDLQKYSDGSARPFVHLLDGGLSDNLGMRGVLELLEDLEGLSYLGQTTPLTEVKRIVIFVVNSMSAPTTGWEKRERPPGEIALLVKATGVPIDHYSYDTVESLRDTIARWQSMRRVRNSPAFDPSRDPETARLLQTPDVDLYAIDVNFAAVKDPAEREFLNNLPTSFNLPDEAVDRLRAAARTIIHESPDFRRLLRDVGAKAVDVPVPPVTPAPR